ncbi:MAG: ThiF family adenylyltransferase [Gemmatimonadota bacterium]
MADKEIGEQSDAARAALPASSSRTGVRRSVAMSADLHQALCEHLLRVAGDEDLTFALWRPSHGATRSTYMLHAVLWPDVGDRQVHGNVSFNLQYVERVLAEAQAQACGVALLHSHIGPGWQSMSTDDVMAERRIAGSAELLTDLPLVGLTLGTDGTWSARVWEHDGTRYEPDWCESVRVVGRRLLVSWTDWLVQPPAAREVFRRTRRVWGDVAHGSLARLRIGIAGLGSVGMAVAEGLARAGHERFVLLDFDEAQDHNMDRLQGAHTTDDVGRLKVELADALIRRSATAASVDIRMVPSSVVEEVGYLAALDCDVLMCCVDRPWARHVLNHIAYAHLIPVIDGGIVVRFRANAAKPADFRGAEWEVRTATPGGVCLACVGAYDPADVDTDQNGLLDDPSYLRGLPDSHQYKQNENVYAFSAALASMECLQLVGLAGQLPSVDGARVQRQHWVAGYAQTDDERHCLASCTMHEMLAMGDTLFRLTGRDVTAAKARDRQAGAGVSSAER